MGNDENLRFFVFHRVSSRVTHTRVISACFQDGKPSHMCLNFHTTRTKVMSSVRMRFVRKINVETMFCLQGRLAQSLLGAQEIPAQLY
jgi:hypothetical protein